MRKALRTFEVLETIGFGSRGTAEPGEKLTEEQLAGIDIPRLLECGALREDVEAAAVANAHPELMAEIQEHEATIAAKDKRITTLEDENADLKQKLAAAGKAQPETKAEPAAAATPAEPAATTKPEKSERDVRESELQRTGLPVIKARLAELGVAEADMPIAKADCIAAVLSKEFDA